MPTDGSAQWITTVQLRQKLGGCSAMTIWRYRREYPDFPKPASFGRDNLFREDEVDAFIERRRTAPAA